MNDEYDLLAVCKYCSCQNGHGTNCPALILANMRRGPNNPSCPKCNQGEINLNQGKVFKCSHCSENFTIHEVTKL